MECNPFFIPRNFSWYFFRRDPCDLVKLLDKNESKGGKLNQAGETAECREAGAVKRGASLERRGPGEASR